MTYIVYSYCKASKPQHLNISYCVLTLLFVNRNRKVIAVWWVEMDSIRFHEFNDDEVFCSTPETTLGTRLGVPFMRAQLECLNLRIGSHTYPIQQSQIGLLAISGVIWDAGLFMADFLNAALTQCEILQPAESINSADAKFPGKTLDLGCGTGIAGIAAAVIGADYVCFSDANISSLLRENIDATLDLIESRPLIDLVSYDWNHHAMPGELIAPCCTGLCAPQWDTILCSDVLYEEKNHEPLLRLLKSIRFNRLIISYKRRHDEPEMMFFKNLKSWCTLRIATAFELVNLDTSAIAGLFIVIAEPTCFVRDKDG